MAALKGSKTEGNLKAAFAGESQANRRYLYFAQKADVEGFNDVSAVFRSTAKARPVTRTAGVRGRRSGDRPAEGAPPIT
jgi:rubrerythrin